MPVCANNFLQVYRHRLTAYFVGFVNYIQNYRVGTAAPVDLFLSS